MILGYILSGLVTGGVFAIMGAGLTLSYAATGVLNFAHGAIGFLTALLFYQLTFVLPAWLAALVAVGVFAPGLGYLLHLSMFRRLAVAGETAQIVATIGLTIALPALGLLAVDVLDLPGADATALPRGIGPHPAIPVGLLDSDQLITFGFSAVAAGFLWLFIRHTPYGLRMRACVDRPRLARLRGIDADATSAVAWMLGSLLAGLAGVLAVPVLGLDATAYTVLLFASATASVFGRLRSIPVTFAAGLGLGVVQNLVAGYTDFLSEITGLRTAVPVILLFAGLLLFNRSRERVAGTSSTDLDTPPSPAPTLPAPPTIANTAKPPHTPADVDDSPHTPADVGESSRAPAAVGESSRAPADVGESSGTVGQPPMRPAIGDEGELSRAPAAGGVGEAFHVPVIAGVGGVVGARSEVGAVDVGRVPGPAVPGGSPRNAGRVMVVRSRLPWAGLVAVLVAFALLGPTYYVGVAAQGLVLALIFCSFVVVTGIGGMVNLAQASFAAMAALTCGWAFASGLPFFAAILLGVLAATLVGVLVALPALRLGGRVLTLATLALALLADQVLFQVDAFSNGTIGWQLPALGLGFADTSSPRVQVLLLLALIGVVALLVRNLTRSASGRAILAVRSAPAAAITSGLSTVRTKITLFALASAIAGLGGVLFAISKGSITATDLPAFSGFVWLAIVVLQGVRRIPGALLGGLIAVAIPELLATWHISSHIGAILFGTGGILLAHHPQGLLPPPTPPTPTTEAPGTEAPGTEAPGTEAPGTEAPGTGVPSSGASGTEASRSGALGAAAPAAPPQPGRPGAGWAGRDGGDARRPGTASAVPSTGAPSTRAPGTDAPGFGALGADAPGATSRPGRPGAGSVGRDGGDARRPGTAGDDDGDARRSGAVSSAPGVPRQGGRVLAGTPVSASPRTEVPGSEASGVGVDGGVGVFRMAGVVAGYGDVNVLRGVDLEVRAGEVVALLGANGAGKSTACAVAAGDLAAWAGSVTLDGRDVTGWPAHRRARAGILLAPEGRGVFPGLSVEENLRTWLPDPAAVYERMPQLAARRTVLAGALSGGEQQLLTLAPALVRPPRVLIADEPSLGLAPLVTGQVFEVFAELRALGVALLLVEEKATEALAIADRVAFMRLGRVTWCGPRQDVDPDRLTAAYLGVL
ncbi:ABC transporter permease subunit [Nonomuraea sediminis]|uniref:ABC transporter permease subunit n=1 Tax=Nonomuraea sediminis TaxID=2835864 RepID=UPI0023DFD49C|nr:ATP-binding cassette domain-containing protein [Nonomuraea sediminis]